MNENKSVNISDMTNLAEYLVALEQLGASYCVIKETNGTFTVFITGF